METKRERNNSFKLKRHEISRDKISPKDERQRDESPTSFYRVQEYGSKKVVPKIRELERSQKEIHHETHHFENKFLNDTSDVDSGTTAAQ